MLIIRKFISLLCLTAALSNGGWALPRISAESAVIMHEDGQPVYSVNAHEPMLIASTTKIMTALIVIENCALEELVEIKRECCNIEGSSMFLREGEIYTVSQLLEGLMLASGNDAAAALALHTAGSEDAFVELMNAKAAELGLDNTHFENPHGLNAPGHCSSAGDMAVLMAHCMKHEYFAYVASMKSTVIKGRTFINHNRLLRMYDGCIGGKTGYTEKAGRCLVSAAERDGTRFICVTLSAPDDWNDHIKLYDYAFANYSLRNVTDGVEFFVPVISGEKSAAALVPEEIRLFLHNSDELELVAYMPEFVFAPVRAGEKCGEFYVMKDDECLARGSLLFRDDIETKRIFRSTE